MHSERTSCDNFKNAPWKFPCVSWQQFGELTLLNIKIFQVTRELKKLNWVTLQKREVASKWTEIYTNVQNDITR